MMFFLLSVIFLLEATRILGDYLFKYATDHGAEYYNGSLAREAFTAILISIAAVFIANILLRAFLRGLESHLVTTFEVKIILELKQKFFNHLMDLSYNFHTSNRTGSLISKLIRGGSAIERLTDVFIFNVAPLIFQMLLIGASLLYFDATSAAVVVCVVAAYIGFSVLMHNIQEKSNVEFNEVEDYEKASISDMFTNFESIKYFGKEQEIKQRYSKLSEDTRKAMSRFWNYYRLIDAGHILILGIGTFLIVYFPMMRFLAGQITLGTVIFIYTTYASLFGNLYGFVHGIKNYYRSMSDFESLFRYYKVKNEIVDKQGATTLKVRHGDIELRSVTFRYKDRDILKDFSLKVPRNHKVALVGPSGAGKSTIIRLLYRLYDVNKGKVLIDGQDVRGVTHSSLRRELSIVPQECVLFDDTIYNNIAFSRPEATREEVLQAMKFAQLDKIVGKFPQKEATIVGERGIKLSGGEKQRVSIARAILADKKILVLDEATSSLDSETESDIQRDLQRLMKGRTSLIIAHRLSTIMKADLIVVIEDGKVVQKGTHAQLISKKGTYQRLWSLQKGGYLA